MNRLNNYKKTTTLKICLFILLAPLSTLLLVYITKITSNNTTSTISIGVLTFCLTIYISLRAIYKLTVSPIELIIRSAFTKEEMDQIDSTTTDKKLLEIISGRIRSTSKGSRRITEKYAIQQATIDELPILLFITDEQYNIKFMNKSASTALGGQVAQFIDNDLFDHLRLLFKNNDTLKIWAEGAATNKVMSTKTWEDVKLDEADKDGRFDIIAKYSQTADNKGNLYVILLDKTELYRGEDTSISNASMVVHELRTPLTMLKGYVELFEDEVGSTLDREHKDFLAKMSTTTKHLTTIVSNILNVSRIDENQFNLRLYEEDWISTLNEIIQDTAPSATIKNKTISIQTKGPIPKVGIDKISMYEVMVNLLDNAIKYSDKSTNINITVRPTSDNLIETIVEDNGIGIPANLTDKIFDKYFRSHRSKTVVGGSGIGLYLVKAIVEAHGGSVWVKSTEGSGSQFGFTLLPYDKIKDELRGDKAEGILRKANGWIKNHSLYRS